MNTLVDTYQSFSGEDFQELDKQLAITQVRVEISHAAINAGEMRIDPLGKGFLLYMFSLN